MLEGKVIRRYQSDGPRLDAEAIAQSNQDLEAHKAERLQDPDKLSK